MSTQLSKAYAGKDVNDLQFDVEAPEELPSDELEDEIDDEPIANSREMTLYLVLATAITMIGLYSLMMVVFAGAVLSSAGIVAIGVGGCVMIAEVKLSKMDSKSLVSRA